MAGKTEKVSTGSRLEVKALKALKEKDAYISLTEDDTFDFTITEIDQKDVEIPGGFQSSGVNDAKGEITFDAPIPFTEAGTYYYLLKEENGNKGDIKYTDTQYKLVITASEEENGTIPVLEESGFTITSIQKYQVKIQGVEVYKKQGNGDWKKVTEQCTYEASDDAHASSLALGKYEGKNENRHLVGGDRASFINEKFDQDYVNIEIKK